MYCRNDSRNRRKPLLGSIDGAIQISQVNTTVGARAVAFTKVTDVLLLLFLKIVVKSFGG